MEWWNNEINWFRQIGNGGRGFKVILVIGREESAKSNL